MPYEVQSPTSVNNYKRLCNMRLYVGCNFISTNNDNNSKPFFNQHLYNVLTKGKTIIT